MIQMVLLLKSTTSKWCCNKPNPSAKGLARTLEGVSGGMGDMRSDVQVCHQRLSSTLDLLLIFLCSLIQTLTLTPPPNNALLANMDGDIRRYGGYEGVSGGMGDMRGYREVWGI